MNAKEISQQAEFIVPILGVELEARRAVFRCNDGRVWGAAFRISQEMEEGKDLMLLLEREVAVLLPLILADPRVEKAEGAEQTLNQAGV